MLKMFLYSFIFSIFIVSVIFFQKASLRAKTLNFRIFSESFAAFAIHCLFGTFESSFLQAVWWVHILLPTSQSCISPGAYLVLVLAALYIYYSTRSPIYALHSLHTVCTTLVHVHLQPLAKAYVLLAFPPYIVEPVCKQANPVQCPFIVSCSLLFRIVCSHTMVFLVVSLPRVS